MKLIELFKLREMAKPSPVHLATTYYHGSSTNTRGEQILHSQIKPGVIELTKRKGPTLEPVLGKVYLTPNLHYGVIYALGGDYAGHSSVNKGFGWLFVIDGSELSDIQPDEDSIGEMIYQTMQGERDEPILKRYAYNVTQILTPGQLAKFKDAEYIMWAHTGKKLLKTMPDADKLAFIDLGAHVANTGTIKYKEAWRIDKSRSSELLKDASNFFEIAERIK